ncbi:lysylphosphatidylglycerol synthase transmembrane domain-containing protein [Ottowia sp.]|uniref:lysylphosphatidylglycerol synthase transmembrane domain-containing protein n=1 Tax=Ottowia sp. TaxID=1898956 RepID=UPI002BBD1D6A|nr:lysylphosphatidylglycerol synthase transmembrane domain-containing protein [Ottowia sp.]HOB65097.1 lysylphosphatidylglycerol synthase transmembrane domain-containing protein [Ottowia sp.]HPZ56268.1 lysylphosphatidylglycerol synthase transmembrane domain-containing protein [Ottowia sp.]HQD46566.1 lysylphosphatidylglycerol synthase transmembrane domain-containing protein [Ottowia sp.]
MKRTRKALLRALLGLALLAGVIALADPARVLAQLRQAHPGWLAAGLVAAIASNVVSALRWRALARWLGAEVSARDATRWYFQAIGLNALLPGAVVGGDVYRAVVLRRAGQDTAASSWSVLLDRLSGLWMLCAIGGLGAALCADVLAPWLRLPPAAFAALMIAGTLLWLALPWALPRLLRRGGQGWLAPLRAAAARPDFDRQLRWQALASAAVQGLSAAALAGGGLALGVHLSPWAWAFAVAPVFLMAALPVSVGGWGTREAAAVAALAPFGVAAPAAVGVGVVYGLYQLAQGAMGALAFGLPAGSAAGSLQNKE